MVDNFRGTHSLSGNGESVPRDLRGRQLQRPYCYRKEAQMVPMLSERWVLGWIIHKILGKTLPSLEVEGRLGVSLMLTSVASKH